MTGMLRNKKVYVGKCGKEVQEKAFRLGCKWLSGHEIVKNLDKPFLYFDDKGRITCGQDITFFNNHDSDEITVEEILATEIFEPENSENKLTCFQEKFEIKIARIESRLREDLPRLENVSHPQDLDILDVLEWLDDRDFETFGIVEGRLMDFKMMDTVAYLNYKDKSIQGQSREFINFVYKKIYGDDE